MKRIDWYMNQEKKDVMKKHSKKIEIRKHTIYGRARAGHTLRHHASDLRLTTKFLPLLYTIGHQAAATSTKIFNGNI